MTKTTIADRQAWIITGPTSGIGQQTALSMARKGTLVLVGRDRRKLAETEKLVRGRGGRAVSVVCDLSDPASIKQAAAEILALNLPLAGLFNNAGMREARPTKTALGWDTTFATNHLGPFLFTEALAPHLPDGAQVLFVVSAVEDPEREPAKRFGLRGSRFISVEASARGEMAPDGSAVPGADAYATSKQAELAAALALARETPRLRINGFEPGFTPGTGLSRDAPPRMRFMMSVVMPQIAPFMKNWSTPKRAGQVAARLLTDKAAPTGVYFDEGGKPMRGSPTVHDPAFQDRVLAETRAFLAGAGSLRPRDNASVL